MRVIQFYQPAAAMIDPKNKKSTNSIYNMSVNVDVKPMPNVIPYTIADAAISS